MTACSFRGHIRSPWPQYQWVLAPRISGVAPGALEFEVVQERKRNHCDEATTRQWNQDFGVISMVIAIFSQMFR